jgi:hypothetical protein
VPTSLASAEEAATAQLHHAGRPFALAIPRLQLLALFGAALAIRLVAVVLLQPRLGGDGGGYIAWAQALVSGSPDALSGFRVEHAPLYGVFLATGLLLPGVQITWFAVLSQSLAGAATVVVLTRLTERETGSGTAGFCAGAIAAVQISFVFWTAYVVSETLFLLIVAITADRVLLLCSSRNPARDGAVVGILALLSIAARPTGVAVVLAMLVVVAMAAHRNRRRLAMLLGSFCLPFAFLLAVSTLAAFISGSNVPSSIPSRVADWTRSAVVDGLLWTESGRATTGIDLDAYPPPVVDTLPPDQRTDFLQAGPLSYAQRHPEFVVAQEARKLRSFWAPALPEYSLRHAIASSLYFLTFDALALAGFVFARRNTAFITLASLSVVLLTLISLITIVDYDQRYRLPGELMLVPFAGLGLTWILERALIHRSKARQTGVPSPAQSVRQ